MDSIEGLTWCIGSTFLRPGALIPLSTSTHTHTHTPSARPRSTVGGAQRCWVRYSVWPHTFVSPSADSKGEVVSYWRKYVHEVLVNRLGGLSLPRKSVVRFTDRPDMTVDVYRGRKTTTTTHPLPQTMNIYGIFK